MNFSLLVWLENKGEQPVNHHASPSPPKLPDDNARTAVDNRLVAIFVLQDTPVPCIDHGEGSSEVSRAEWRH